MGIKQTSRFTLALTVSTAVACGFVAAVYQLLQSIHDEVRPGGFFYWPALLISVAGVCIFSLLSLLLWDVLRHRPADSLPFLTLRQTYIMIRKMYYHGPRAVKRYVAKCKDVPAIQENVLLDILQRNKDSAYGKDKCFHEIDSIKQFQKQVPINRYKDFKPYIDRLADGEKSVLTKEDIVCFAKSSGTTGKAKLIPVTKNYLGSLGGDVSYIFQQMPLAAGAKVHLGKSVVLGHTPPVDTTKSGLKAGPLTFFFQVHSLLYTSPKDVYGLTHENTAFYVHAIFALKEREVSNMRLLFAHQAYSFFTFVEERWQSLCHDIETGTLTRDGLIIDDTLYQTLSNHLRPDAKRAQELRKEFEKGKIRLGKRLWPDLEMVLVITTGSMVIYGELLVKTYLKDVIIIQNGYGGSEGFYGVNLAQVTHDRNYTLAFPFTFCEFIPEDKVDEEQPETILAHEVQKGCNYELVITNGNGLYRYRVEDVVRITQFVEKCPVMEIQYRSGQVLNLLGEKMNDAVLYKALYNASQQLGVSLIDYTTCEDICLHDIADIAGYIRHYVLFIELDRKISDDECKKFDECLCKESEIYSGMLKNRQSVTGMEVIQLQPGTFETLKQTMIQESQNMQFKMPRTMRSKDYLKILLDRRI